jgi:hypothetical protein
MPFLYNVIRAIGMLLVVQNCSSLYAAGALLVLIFTIFRGRLSREGIDFRTMASCRSNLR